jgi:hypothetical protein
MVLPHGAGQIYEELASVALLVLVLLHAWMWIL